MVRVLISGFFLLLGGAPGFAHTGHLVDLAGHSHWLGWGMVAVAGVIVAVVSGSKSKDTQDDGEEITDEEIGGETTPS